MKLWQNIISATIQSVASEMHSLLPSHCEHSSEQSLLIIITFRWNSLPGVHLRSFSTCTVFRSKLPMSHSSTKPDAETTKATTSKLTCTNLNSCAMTTMHNVDTDMLTYFSIVFPTALVFFWCCTSCPHRLPKWSNLPNSHHTLIFFLPKEDGTVQASSRDISDVNTLTSPLNLFIIHNYIFGEEERPRHSKWYTHRFHYSPKVLSPKFAKSLPLKLPIEKSYTWQAVCYLKMTSFNTSAVICYLNSNSRPTSMSGKPCNFIIREVGNRMTTAEVWNNLNC